MRGEGGGRTDRLPNGQAEGEVREGCRKRRRDGGVGRGKEKGKRRGRTRERGAEAREEGVRQTNENR